MLPLGGGHEEKGCNVFGLVFCNSVNGIGIGKAILGFSHMFYYLTQCVEIPYFTQC